MQQGLLISCLDVPDVFEAVRVASAIGYRNVELSVCPRDTRPNLVDLSDSQRQDVRKRVDNLGLRISSLQCHIHNGYGDADPSVRYAAVEHTKRMLDVAASMAVDIVHTVSGIAEDSSPHDEKLDRVAACYEEIFKNVGSVSPHVAIEPCFVYVVGNLAHTRSLYQRLGDLPLYINYDPSHFSYHDESPISFIQAFSDKFIHAHSKDSRLEDVLPGTQVAEEDLIWLTPDGKRTFRFVAPGRGTVPWDQVMAELQNAGFDGVISLEMGHGYEGNPEDIARATYEFFKTQYDLS